MKRGRLCFLLLAAVLCMAGSLAVLAQTTDLRVTKSGGDAVLDWTGGSANFGVVKSNNDPRFPFPQTLAADLPSSPYTYSGAVNNGQTMEFIVVVGNGESGPAGNYTGGATPPPIPIISSVSPTSGLKVGDPLTFNGSGFSAIAKEDVVHFPEGVTAVADPALGTVSATVFTVRIPRGALSGPAWVQVGNQVSGSMNLVILTQAGFQNLSGVAYQPTTHDIWLADRGWGSSYYTRILQAIYNKNSDGRWGTNEYDTATSGSWKYQGGQGFDSGQNWYYGVAASAAGGGARTVTTGTTPPVASSFMQVKPGSSDYLYVIGAATSPALTNTAFFAYNDSTTGEKHIRELNCASPPCTGGSGTVVDPDYGNFGATNLNFNTLAGLALDQNGNLFDTETTQVREITPSQTSSIVITGFSGAMGIAVDQVNTSDPGELLVSDSSANTLYGVDLLLPQKQTVISGLAGHRAASFAVTPLNTTTCSTLPNADLAFVVADETTQVRQVPDPRITLTPAGPTRVWISKQRTDDQYPSPYQSTDHQINITATTTPGRTVYFRVIDPPDLAPYADGTTTGYWCGGTLNTGDNRDQSTTNNHGKLWDTGTSTWKDVVSVQADASTGKASVILNITDRYAGDNYIVQASFDDWSTSNTTKALAETGIITAWKRVYIEKDMMFRQGGILKSDAFQNDNYVTVYNWANLPACGSTPGPSPCYQIAIIDSTHPYDGAHDEPYVGWVTPNGTDALDLHLVKADMTAYTLAHPYTHSPYPTFGATDGVTSGDSAGVGVIGSGFYDADLSDMWQTYNDAFVEFWVPPDGAGAVPYLPQGWFDTAATADMARFSQIWFKNFQPWNINTPPFNTPHNYFHLIGASTANVEGLTNPAYNWTYIMVQSLENNHPTQKQNAIRETTVHELAHEFDTNFCSDVVDCSAPPPPPPPPTWGKHDYRYWWFYESPIGKIGCPPTAPCIMQPSGGNVEGTVHRLCEEDLLLGDPNAPCTTPGGATFTKADTAVRTAEDPK